jgi:hypothetical protein
MALVREGVERYSKILRDAGVPLQEPS